MVIPCCANSFITSRTSPTISGSRAEVGSSKSMMSGFMAKPRAIATRCFCPPDKLSGVASALSSRPTRFNKSIANLSASSLVIRPSSTGANVTFSSTDMCGKRLKCWKTIPMFSRALSTFVLGSDNSKPSTITLPDVIVSSRLRVRRKVDLPEPEGPMIQTTSPS